MFLFFILVIASDKLAPRMNQKIFEALQVQETEIFTPKIVYDNRKIAFSSRELPFGDADARTVTLETVLGDLSMLTVFSFISVVRCLFA